MTHKKGESEEMSCFEVLDVLYGGLGKMYCKKKGFSTNKILHN
jgi:hypothetical protein